jgi:murein DD-endopeptidase MepM/ murein hydrolase activator NlpD
MRQGFRSRALELVTDRTLQVLTVVVLAAATAAAASPIRREVAAEARDSLSAVVERVNAAARPETEVLRLVWEGADVDGDGRADFANPTGQAPRGHDAYGEGEFGARRDGGSRRHEGVDFVADAGQTVRAPISGYITKIGYAYSGDQTLRFVEITNPALDYAARVFYVTPQVRVGDAVAVGRPIGTARSLQGKYPGGMTDHVHLEVIDRRGRRIDAAKILSAEYISDARAAGS